MDPTEKILFSISVARVTVGPLVIRPDGCFLSPSDLFTVHTILSLVIPS